MRMYALVLACAALAASSGARTATALPMPQHLASWPSKAVSFWYSADESWPALIAQISPHVGNESRASSVTSVQIYCGLDVSDAGTIIDSFSSACAGVIPALTALGVRAELVLNSGNCSIDAYRLLWADTHTAPRQLLAALLAANASGLNIDNEPITDDCKGGVGSGEEADAALFATWLAAVRTLLNGAGLRLTVDVASWSPVIGEYAVLAGSVDRLQCMGTYNGESEVQWRGWYDGFIAAAPRAVAGVGLGAWLDGANASAWWETPEAAAIKVAQARADGIPELAVFNLNPMQKPAWPLDYWWPLLDAFIASA